jgi:sulfonate dioxygenase
MASSDSLSVDQTEQPFAVRTSFTPNLNFVPPTNLSIPSNLEAVPINPKGPTEFPEKIKGYIEDDYKYKDFLPHVTLTSEPALSPYEHVDVASRADSKKSALFGAIPSRKDTSPNIGSEVHGIQLSQLNNVQKDELALWVAERGLVIFRGQDFVDQGMDWMKVFGSYFGRLHTHQWGPHPKGHPDLDISFRDSDGTYFDNELNGTLNSVAWHTDM